MRALVPESSEAVDLHAHYARDWIGRGGIRANMIASADGSAAVEGLSGGLQTPGDNRVFASLRDLADVVLVGSTTAHAEGYRPVRMNDDRFARRGEYGLGARLPIAVVTRSLRVDRSDPLFADPDNRPLVVTCASSDASARADLGEHAEVVVCGGNDIDYGAVRREFADRGLVRVLCEGGPTVLGQLARSGELDELCLSVSPFLAGPGAGRILRGDPWPGDPRGMRLHSLLEEAGALFLRYVIATAGPPADLGSAP